MSLIQHFKVAGPHVIHETLDGEVIIINLDSGSYYSLDPIGADIWAFIENGTTVEEIATMIAHHYDSNGVGIENAVSEFLEELQKEGLIIPDTGALSGRTDGPKGKIETGSATTLPVFSAPVLHKYTDMEELLLLDPIHEVDETGWPKSKAESSNETD